jgi:predicted phosphodiesterase
VKIVITSDIHGFLPEIPECDLLLLAGDIVPRKEYREKVQKDWLTTYFRPWLDAQPSGKTFFVAGNHDLAFEDLRWSRKHFPEYLYLEKAVYQGVTVWGSPFAQYGRDLAFQKSEAWVSKAFRKITPDVDIILSHGPLFSILDHRTGWKLQSEIDRIQPHLFVSGHIHNAFGFYVEDGVLYLNASFLSSKKIPAHPLWTIGWGERGIEYLKSEKVKGIDNSAVPKRVRHGKRAP